MAAKDVELNAMYTRLVAATTEVDQWKARWQTWERRDPFLDLSAERRQQLRVVSPARHGASPDECRRHSRHPEPIERALQRL